MKGNGKLPAPPSEWRDLIEAGADEGTRDCSLARLDLLRRRIHSFVVRELLQSWNVTHCRPPLPQEDVERIVNSIAGKELRRRQAGG